MSRSYTDTATPVELRFSKVAHTRPIAAVSDSSTKRRQKDYLPPTSTGLHADHTGIHAGRTGVHAGHNDEIQVGER